jgi:hypothetical protein
MRATQFTITNMIGLVPTKTGLAPHVCIFYFSQSRVTPMVKRVLDLLKSVSKLQYALLLELVRLQVNGIFLFVDLTETKLDRFNILHLSPSTRI